MRRWLLLFLLCVCVGGGISTIAHGQVIIRERMELDKNALVPQASQTEPPVQSPLQSDLLIPVEFDQLLALADGTLLVDFTEAFADQLVDFPAESLVVEISRQGETLRHELFPADYLPGPLTVSTAGSFCQDWIYSSVPYLYSSRTDNAVISRDVDRPPFPSDINEDAEANSPLISVSKTVESDPDFFSSDEERSLLWLPALQTNGLAEHAELVLVPSFNPIQPVRDPEAVTFPMLLYRATNPWTPEQVRWDTQPGVTDLVIVEENTLDLEQVEVTVDITSIGQFWVANPEQVYGLALYPEQFSGNGSRLSRFKGLSSPWVNIELTNPNPPAESLSQQIPIQAGDIVKFFFRERSHLNGFFEYETDGYGILFEETTQFGQAGQCRDIELSLRAGLAPSGPPPSIALRPEPDTLAAGGQSLLGLEIAFSNGLSRPFPFQQRFDLEILSGQDLGVLRAADTGQTGSSLQQAGGEVFFEAFPGIPQAGQTVQIGAATLLEPYGEISIGAAPDDGSLQMQPAQAASASLPEDFLPPADTEPSPAGIELTGSGVITIQEEDDIQINITADADSVYPLRTGGIETSEIQVHVLRDNEPVFGFPVQLEVTVVSNSGGHDHHDDERPAGTLNSAAGETNENGVFNTTFTSSEVAGTEWIVATSPETAVKDSLEMIIRVPDLVELVNGDDYILIGQTGIHPDNHWGASDVIESIQTIASAWKDMFPNESLLMINDISLNYGGVFDINENWKNPHSLHRTGRDIDVRTEFPDGIDEFPMRPGVPIRVPRSSKNVIDIAGNPRFENIVRDKGAVRLRIHGTLGTRNEHYHIYY